ncbi:MAG TPA: BON domain-containing protein [Rhodanobacteraceae bacterium]
MKTQIAAAIASLVFAASLGTAAYAQDAQQTPPQSPPPVTAASNYGQSNAMSNNNGTSGNNEEQIEQKIKHELTSHGVTATNVNVSFNNGTATLSGTVYNQKDIKKAKKEAMRVHGVKHVDVSGLQAQQSPNSSSTQGD